MYFFLYFLNKLFACTVGNIWVSSTGLQFHFDALMSCLYQQYQYLVLHLSEYFWDHVYPRGKGDHKLESQIITYIFVVFSKKWVYRGWKQHNFPEQWFSLQSHVISWIVKYKEKGQFFRVNQSIKMPNNNMTTQVIIFVQPVKMYEIKG